MWVLYALGAVCVGVSLWSLTLDPDTTWGDLWRSIKRALKGGSGG